MHALPVAVFDAVTPKGRIFYVAVNLVEGSFRSGVEPVAIMGQLTAEWSPEMPIVEKVFQSNPVFVAFLHSIVARFAPRYPAFQREAQMLGEGNVFVVDQRTATPSGPIPPEDIIGAFPLTNGHTTEGGYRPSPYYRVLTSRGFPQLPGDLILHFVHELSKKANL